MAVVKTEDIVGYWFDEETVCVDCATREEADGATLDEIMTADELAKDDELV